MVNEALNVIMSIFQAILIFIVSPLFIGIINKTKATLQSRKGPPILQPYYNLVRLFNKGSVISKNTSWIFQLTPYVNLILIGITTLMVPVFYASSLDIIGGIIVAIYLMAGARLFMILAGLDAGTAFGGMGSSREALISALIEPIALLCLFTVAILTNTLFMGSIARIIADSGFTMLRPSLILASIAFFVVALAENARIPVDNPTTHLELTMVHEAMILEYSGKPLGLMEWSSWIKHVVIFTMLANLYYPWGIATQFTFGALFLGIIVYIAKLFILAILVAFVESAISKLRLFRLPNLLGIAFTMSLTAILVIYIL